MESNRRSLRMISTMDNAKLRFFALGMVSLMVIFTVPLCRAVTNQQDVNAINSFYVSLGSPLLPGWVSNGGDPCSESWQGVQCVGTSISAITINSANLGGRLSDDLGNFTSIDTIDLSNNNIGGSIPENLPLSLKTFFLSANQLTGKIPSSLSQLTLLSAMSLNQNHLSEDLPDAFQSLTGLVNLDMSSNNLSGQLPPSMEGLLSLTTLRIQDNQLSGTLDVLQDLPLKDLNIQNNLFSGPIPQQLLSIPNFKKDGNPFNSTSIAPSTVPSPVLSPDSPPFPFPKAPAPRSVPSNSSDGPSKNSTNVPSKYSSHGKTNSLSRIKIVGLVFVGVVSFIVIVLAVIFCMYECQERRSTYEETPPVRQEVMAREQPKVPRNNEHFARPNTNIKKVGNASEEHKNELEVNTTGTGVPLEIPENKKKEHIINMSGSEEFLLPPPPPPTAEMVIVNPIVPPETVMRAPTPATINTPTSAASYSVASLQQYTNSFSEENLIRDSRLGKVYLAELPDGKLLTVTKLEDSKISEDEFLELVLSVSELRHPNIVELVGYCAEFGQRLLVYNYFSRRTLTDILHYEDDLKKKLSWNARLKVALGAAKALEYLHEGCHPPIVHQDFEPNNILLNDKLAVRISDCGMAPLLKSNSVTQLSGRIHALLIYEAPEINESGSYTDRSDAYSFGVVMLELLTGRKPYDSSLPRPEQHLVRWARSQLHDINNISRMVDPSLGGNCPMKSLSQFADIISRCIQQGPEFRPPMSEVVQDLTRMLDDARREHAEASMRSRRTREEKQFN